MPVRVRLVTLAGPLIGRGHLARALSLAEADWGPAATLELEVLDGSATDPEAARAAAMGCVVVNRGAPAEAGSLVVIDAPDPDPIAGRFDADRLAVFDDREAFRGRAAVVVQPSLPAWTGPAQAAAVLAGFEYAPVSAEIRQRRAADPSSAPGVRPRLLVCFGGSDPGRVTERLALALAASVDAQLELVIGASYSGPTDGWPVAPLRDPADLVERLASADLALLGAGTIKFEAACLGRPMALVAVADDQLPVGPAFAATGAARYLGDGRTVEPDAVVRAVTELLGDERARQALAATAANVIDGRGADRVARAVTALAQPAGSS
jgi:spore coat polysaccharide biosynthesis predicted glycosyltransferase SpsG